MCFGTYLGRVDHEGVCVESSFLLIVQRLSDASQPEVGDNDVVVISEVDVREPEVPVETLVGGEVLHPRTHLLGVALSLGTLRGSEITELIDGSG